MKPTEPESTIDLTALLCKDRLMVPGPTPLPPSVSAAASLPMVDERTHGFAEVFKRIQHNLRQFFGAAGDVLVFTSSTTGAFESAVQNLFCAGDRVLVVNNGEFGSRWVRMCRAFGLDVVDLVVPWGDEIDLGALASHLSADPRIVAVVAVHCETSTGAVSDLKELGLVTRNVLTIVDSASGLGACELLADEWGLDVVVSGAQKALMAPPGVSFVTVNERAWSRQQCSTLPKYYFDWSIARDSLRQAIPRTPWTPAIGVLVQLDASLTLALDEGIDARLRRHTLLGRLARAGLRGLGLRMLTPPLDRNAVVTGAFVPDGVDAQQLVDVVAQQTGVQLAAGNGELVKRVIRLGHCGYVDALDIVAAVAGLEVGLRSVRLAISPGAGVVPVLQQLSEDCTGLPPDAGHLG